MIPARIGVTTIARAALPLFGRKTALPAPEQGETCFARQLGDLFLSGEHANRQPPSQPVRAPAGYPSSH
jgi:hypothetical protein